MIYQLVPLITAGLFFIGLIGYSKIITEKSDTLSKLYGIRLESVKMLNDSIVRSNTDIMQSVNFEVNEINNISNTMNIEK